MAEVLVTLIVFGIVFALGAAWEHTTRPKTLHADDWTAEGGMKR